MKTLWLALLVLWSLLLAACTSVPTSPEATLVPQPSAVLNEALKGPKSCERPAVARQKVDPDFKYGCFCGKNHPDINLPSGRKFENLDEEERTNLIAKYYAILPVDDIDSACQSHDICWILNGRPEQECNESFRARLESLKTAWESRIGWFDTDTLEWRCAAIALDMSFATLAIMEGVSNDLSSEVGLKAARLFSAPIVLLYATVMTIFEPFNSYPTEGEVCREPPPLAPSPAQGHSTALSLAAGAPVSSALNDSFP